MGLAEGMGRLNDPTCPRYYICSTPLGIAGLCSLSLLAFAALAACAHHTRRSIARARAALGGSPGPSGPERPGVGPGSSPPGDADRSLVHVGFFARLVCTCWRSRRLGTFIPPSFCLRCRQRACASSLDNSPQAPLWPLSTEPVHRIGQSAGDPQPSRQGVSAHAGNTDHTVPQATGLAWRRTRRQALLTDHGAADAARHCLLSEWGD